MLLKISISGVYSCITLKPKVEAGGIVQNASVTSGVGFLNLVKSNAPIIVAKLVNELLETTDARCTQEPLAIF